MICKIIFWLSFLFILYTYAGYPLLLLIWARLCPRAIIKVAQSILPTVSVVIAAKNEENAIGKRIENLIAQDYPKSRLQIIVVSDGSDDNTVAIVARFCEQLATAAKQGTADQPRLDLVNLSRGEGKPNALNHGLAKAAGEIIVFADARQTFAPDAIKELVANFNDPAVGCVSGELFFVNDSNSTINMEMGLYWQIEKMVRKLESHIGSVAGATGAIYAIRRTLYRDLPKATLLDDVMTPMNIVLQGYRTIFDRSAKAYDQVSGNAATEWRRKVRTLAGNWQFITLRPALFFPVLNPIWWRFLSHKIFRLLVPFGLPVLLICSLLVPGDFYRAVALIQIVFYLAAAIGWFIPGTRSLRLVKLSYFFMVLNTAAIAGCWYWATGRCGAAWK